MAITEIRSPAVPAPIGCYSQAVRAGDRLYLSGQIGISPKTNALVSNDFEEQLIQIFHNMEAIITAAGATFSHVVKLTIFLKDLQNFPQLNEIMGNYFHAPYPARSTIAVSGLPKDAQVEIEAILYLS